VCVRQCPYSPLCVRRTCILSRRQAYKHTQDMRFSSSGSGGRTRRPIPAVCCVGDSKTSRPARPPPIAGRWAVVGGVVTVRGRLPVTVPRPGDGPGPLARGCYEPSPRQWPAALLSPRRGRALVSSGAGVGERGRVWGSDPRFLHHFLLEHSEGDCAFES
jgi:hypothetical protein